MTKKLTPKQLAANVAAGKKAGRPEFVPTPEHRALVVQLAGLGATQALMATFIKNPQGVSISVDTLTAHFRTELDAGMDQANLQVARTMFKLATDGIHEGSTKFWLERRAPGWGAAVQLTGKEGAPLHPVQQDAVTIDEFKAALDDVLKAY